MTTATAPTIGIAQAPSTPRPSPIPTMRRQEQQPHGGDDMFSVSTHFARRSAVSTTSCSAKTPKTSTDAMNSVMEPTLRARNVPPKWKSTNPHDSTNVAADRTAVPESDDQTGAPPCHRQKAGEDADETQLAQPGDERDRRDFRRRPTDGDRLEHVRGDDPEAQPERGAADRGDHERDSVCHQGVC